MHLLYSLGTLFIAASLIQSNLEAPRGRLSVLENKAAFGGFFAATGGRSLLHELDLILLIWITELSTGDIEIPTNFFSFNISMPHFTFFMGYIC